MKRAVEAVVLLMGLTALGCGSAGRSPAEQHTHEYAVAVCDAWFSCPVTHAGDAVDRLTIGTPAECVRRIESRARTALLDQQLASGTVRIDQAAFDACVANVRRLCVDSFSVFPCDDIRVGTVALDGACRFDSECMSGHCSATASSCGACLVGPTTGLGEICSTSDECAPSSEGRVDCVIPDGEPVGTCEVIDEIVVGLGEACGLGVGPNGEDQYCGADRYCDFDGVCAAVRALGDACVSDHDACATDTACLNGEDGVTACRTAIIRRSAGEHCDLWAATPEICDAWERLECDEGTNTCVALGDGSSGAACTWDEDCQTSHFCFRSGDSGTCRAKLADGETCTRSSECASEVCYGGEAKTCTSVDDLRCE